MPARQHRTIDRVTRILELVATTSRGYTLTEIATQLEEPRSSIQGFVYGLVDTGYLDEQDHHYFVGTAPLALASAANRHVARYIHHEELEKLAEATGCGVAIGVRMGRSVSYIEVAGPDSALEDYLLRRQVRRSDLISAAGQMLLSDLAPEDLREHLDREPDQDLVVEYLSKVNEIRRNGFVLKETSLIHGQSVIATGVRDGNGRMYAAIVATALPEYIRENRDRIITEMHAAAKVWQPTSRFG